MMCQPCACARASGSTAGKTLNSNETYGLLLCKTRGDCLLHGAKAFALGRSYARRCSKHATFLCAIGAGGALCGSWAGAQSLPELELAAASSSLDQITVTAKRVELLGTADSASVGVVADEEIQLTPAYRPGQILETVPGLIVTLHSGEGKANQLLLRGYNLDHGTDLATFVDAMPINQPTHAHGQGYTDLNFMIPELADEITYTKGTYYPTVGDFGAVGSLHVSYRDTMPD